jgi:DNA modification methylase
MADDVRVIHGDAVAVMAGMEAGSVDAIVTDPPYGIGYRAERCGKPGRTDGFVDWGTIANDEDVDGRWLAGAFRVLKDGGALYFCTRWDVEPRWREECRAAGFAVKQRLQWHKRVFGHGDTKGTFGPTCEDVLFVTKGRHELNSRPSMLLDVGCVPTWEKRHHPHQKPVALSKILIEASTRHGDLVLDPFAGSGSTLVACVKSGRRAIGIEVDPDYIPIIIHRLRDAETPLFSGL